MLSWDILLFQATFKHNSISDTRLSAFGSKALLLCFRRNGLSSYHGFINTSGVH